MKIANPKTETENTSELNDKDYMNRLLTSLKELEKNYAVALTEMSNETLYKSLYEQFKNIADMQRKTFELMFQNGWYEIETADRNKIKTKYESLCKDFEAICDNK